METATSAAPPLLDFEPDTGDFRKDVLAGLNHDDQKTLPCKYFYDERGSKLFDRICTLDEYYLTRTEMAIMETHIDEMVDLIGPRALLVEYGSGSSLKTRILLDHLPDLAAYVPLDIAREHLLQSARELQAAYPDLLIRPVCADYMNDFHLPDIERPSNQTIVYFPGSTIGNLEPDVAVRFLQNTAERAGPGSSLLLGVDLDKDRATLEAAYNDSEGVAAAFNKNLLRRINRELDANFDLDQFAHRATYRPERRRVESHLVSQTDQHVQVGEATFFFAEGETIHTENSYKYDPDEFTELARRGGYAVERVWTDPDDLFSVQYLVAGQ